MRTLLLLLARRRAAAAAITSGQRPFFSFASPAQALVKSHRETKIVPFSREEMFDVVVDVNRYHEFLPFCVESRVLRRPNENVMEAALRVGFKVFTESYTSRVIMKRPEKVVIKSIESPTFKRIESEWVFRETGDPNSCMIDFSVTFEVASFLHANAIQLFFDDVAVAQLSAFIERARRLHGSRPQPTATAATMSQGDSTFPIPPSVAKSVQQTCTGAELTAAQRAAESVKTAMSAQQSHDLEALFERYASEPDKMYQRGFEQACCALSGEHADFKALAESSALAGAVFSSLGTSSQPKEWLDLDEFVVGVYLMTRGTVEQKAQSLFHAIDTLCDGKISREELTSAMQQRIRSVRRIFPKLLQDQVALQLQQRGAAAPLSADADAAMARALAAIETLMEEVEKDIPLAVNQIFVEADLNQDDFISHDEWLYAWQTHPEFVELMTIDGMKKFAQWASVVRADEKEALDTRLTYMD